MDLQGKTCVCYVRAFKEKILYKEATELIVYCFENNGVLFDPCYFYDLESYDNDEIRPGLDGLIEMVKTEDIDIVLVYSYHRFFLDYERYKREIESLFNEYGVEVIPIQKEVEAL